MFGTRKTRARFEAVELKVRQLGEDVDRLLHAVARKDELIAELENQLAIERAKVCLFDLAEYDVAGACYRMCDDTWHGIHEVVELASAGSGETMLRIVGGIEEPVHELFEPVAYVSGVSGSGLKNEHGPTPKVREYLESHRGTLVYERPPAACA